MANSRPANTSEVATVAVVVSVVGGARSSADIAGVDAPTDSATAGQPRERETGRGIRLHIKPKCSALICLIYTSK